MAKPRKIGSKKTALKQKSGLAEPKQIKPISLFLLAGGLIILDQLTKLSIRLLMDSGSQIKAMGPILYLTYVQNTGAAFGSFHGTNSMLIWLAIIAIGLIFYLWENFPKTNASQLFLTFIVAGSVGNLIDRVFLGYVTDFLDISIWPVFNVADSLVTIGVIGLIYVVIRDKPK